MTKYPLSVVASFGTIVSGSDSITIVIEPFAPDVDGLAATAGAAGLSASVGLAAAAGAAVAAGAAGLVASAGLAASVGLAASAGLAGSAGLDGAAGACGAHAAMRPATPTVMMPHTRSSRLVNRRAAGAG